MWLVGVVVSRYIDFLILLMPTPLVLAFFCSSILTFCSFLKCFFVLIKKDRSRKKGSQGREGEGEVKREAEKKRKGEGKCLRNSEVESYIE